MLDRAYQAEALTSSSWVTADEAYGENPAFRERPAAREVPFAPATRNDDLLTSSDGHRRPAEVLATIAGIGEDGAAGDGWERRSMGRGAHGEREYDGTAVALDTGGLPDGWGTGCSCAARSRPSRVGRCRSWRSTLDGPANTPLRELIQAAGARWAIEECSQTAKNEAGLDHYQVRTLRAWYAHVTLAMLALASLAATRAREYRNDGGPAAEEGDLATAPNS